MLVSHLQSMTLLPLRHWCVLQGYDIFGAGCLSGERWQEICIHHDFVTAKS